MVDPVSEASQAGQEQSSPVHSRFPWKRVGIIFAATTGLWCFLFGILAVETHANFFIRHIALPTLLVALIVTLAIRQDRRWHRPAERFKNILKDIRESRMPIDALEEVDGALVDLRDLVENLLRDLRQHKQQIAELNAEMSVKVASRTDALERTIGSLRTQATRDALTGLYNRRMLDEYFPRILDRCREEGEQFAVLMIDVDNFKPINDSLGHAAGDELLRNISQIMRSTIRDHDAAFRCGGDEFVILLPRCPELGARKLADRLISLVDALAKTIKSPLPAKLSIGMAVLKDPASTMQSLMQEADAQLYEVKRQNKAKLPPAAIRLARAG